MFERDMSHGWARKLGIVAKRNGATLNFEFPSIGMPLRVLTLQSLRSYGESWEGSQVVVKVGVQSPTSSLTNSTIESSWSWVHNETIAGCHNSTSSITFDTEMVFANPIPSGSDVRIHIQLVGGTTFKITGMMLCSR